jgi:signal transduction histidine kinase
MKVYENAVNNLSEMVKVELLEPFNAMTDVLNELDAVVSVLLQKEEQEAGLSYGHFDAITPEPSTEFRPVQHLQSEIKRLKTVGSGFVERAGQLALLAKTYSDAAMTANHRIDVMEMVKAALDRSEPILKARQIKVSYVGMSDELPTLYGSSEWLARALSEYVNFVADHAEPDSRFLFTVRGNGNYVLLALKNTGFSLPPAMMHRAFMPFCQGVGGAEAGQGLGLGLAVSKRIIELHGGQMRIKEDVEGSMDLLIELPAGELRRAKPQDGIEQAQRYAEDLARLVQQRTSGAAMSHIH